MRWIREMICWLKTRHVYNDGPWRPANECFWCGKKKPNIGTRKCACTARMMCAFHELSGDPAIAELFKKEGCDD